MRIHELNEAFDRVSATIKNLPSNAGMTQGDMIQLYALYKQSTEGPCVDRPKPSFFDLQGKYKRDAWMALGDMSSHKAKEQYIELALVLLQNHPEELRALKRDMKLKFKGQLLGHRKASSADGINNLVKHEELNNYSDHDDTDDKSLYYDAKSTSGRSRHRTSLPGRIDEDQSESQLTYEDVDMEDSYEISDEATSVDNGNHEDDYASQHEYGTDHGVPTQYGNGFGNITFHDDVSPSRVLHSSDNEQLDDEDDPLHVKEPLIHGPAPEFSPFGLSQAQGSALAGSTAMHIPVAHNSSPPVAIQQLQPIKVQHSPMHSFAIDSMNPQQRSYSPQVMLQVLQGFERRLSDIELKLAESEEAQAMERKRRNAFNVLVSLSISLLVGYLFRGLVRGLGSQHQ